MQTIQLDISSDIFEKVIAFLEILPKDKIQIKKIDNQNQIDRENFIFQTLQIESMNKTWDNKEDEVWDGL
jgi:hypothetical protein